jgi:flagellar basal body-associated protein FliL
MNRRAVLLAGLLALTPAAALAAPPKKKSAGSGTTLIFPTLTSTILRPDGRRGVLTVEVVIDAPDEALRARADQSRPLLRDAWNTVLIREGAAMRPGAPPDVERLSRELQKACDRVLGRAGARVLLGSVIVN